VVRQARFRALITLYSLGPRPEALHAAAPQFHNHTRALMVRARPLRQAGSTRYFPSEISWDSGQPLRRGDSCVVTVTVTDDEAGEYLGAGQRFTLWPGGEVGHSAVSSKVYTEDRPAGPRRAGGRGRSRRRAPVTGAVETFGLTKRYGSVTAASDLSLRIETGQVFGFLGPNGAGKSTTIRMLMALQRPTEAGSRSLVSMPRPIP
jgi:ABC-type glutathione transport system ATPase component